MNKHKYFIPFYIFTAIIFYLSLANLSQFQFKSPLLSWDKFWHFLVYFIDSILLISAFILSNKKLILQHLYFTFLICLFIGTLMEFLQVWLTNYRHFDYEDMLANGAGAMFTCVLFLLIKNKINVYFK